MKNLLTNWKTSGVALLSAILGLLNYIYPDSFTTQLNVQILGILVLVFGLVAKDSSVTGGTVINNPNDASVVKEAAKKDV